MLKTIYKKSCLNLENTLFCPSPHFSLGLWPNFCLVIILRPNPSKYFYFIFIIIFISFYFIYFYLFKFKLITINPNLKK